MPLVAGLALACAAACATSPAPTSAPTAERPAAADPRIQRVLDAWAARNPALARTGGVAVAAIPAGGRRTLAAAGTAGPGRPRLTGTEWFRLGSVTRTYVATALLRLAADGRVDLDAPVSRYAAGVPRIGRATVRQLLDHTAGVPDYVATPRWRQAVEAAPDRVWTAREVLRLVPATPPTGRYAYSNTHYVLAGLVLESVTGRPWTAAVRSTVLDPLRLAGTDTTGDGRAIVDGQIAVDDTTVLAVSDLAPWRRPRARPAR